MKRAIPILVGLVFIATVGITVSAQSGSVTDPIGDVMHWRHTDTTWGWETNVVNKLNIDITEISYTVSGDRVTLSLKVAGTVTNSDLVSYYAYLNTSDSNYILLWTNGEGSGWAMNTEEGSFQMDSDPDITSTGDTITATYDVVGALTTGVNLWGWAAEYTVYGDTMHEWWADWAPNEESPYYDQYTDDAGEDDAGADDSGSDDISSDDVGDDTDDSTDTGASDDLPEEASDTPGFEMIMLIAAIGVALVLLRKKK